MTQASGIRRQAPGCGRGTKSVNDVGSYHGITLSIQIIRSNGE